MTTSKCTLAPLLLILSACSPACTAPAASPERSCEAWYFAAEHRLVSGDRAGARTAFERSVSTHSKGISAWSAARAELMALMSAKK